MVRLRLVPWWARRPPKYNIQGIGPNIGGVPVVYGSQGKTAVAMVKIRHADEVSREILDGASAWAQRKAARRLPIAATLRLRAEILDEPGPSSITTFRLYVRSRDPIRDRRVAVERFAARFVQAMRRRGFDAFPIDALPAEVRPDVLGDEAPHGTEKA